MLLFNHTRKEPISRFMQGVKVGIWFLSLPRDHYHHMKNRGKVSSQNYQKQWRRSSSILQTMKKMGWFTWLGEDHLPRYRRNTHHASISAKFCSSIKAYKECTVFMCSRYRHLITPLWRICLILGSIFRNIPLRDAGIFDRYCSGPSAKEFRRN